MAYQRTKGTMHDKWFTDNPTQDLEKSPHSCSVDEKITATKSFSNNDAWKEKLGIECIFSNHKEDHSSIKPVHLPCDNDHVRPALDLDELKKEVLLALNEANKLLAFKI